MPSVYTASVSYFFFNDTATTEIYTLSLHDALPILPGAARTTSSSCASPPRRTKCGGTGATSRSRSEEHTSELQSHSDLVCRLLLEKKKKTLNTQIAVNTAHTAQATTSRHETLITWT